MIQRVQTLLLIFALIAMTVLMMFPLIGLERDAFKKVIEGWEVGYSTLLGGESYKILINLILVGTAAGFSLISIFLFKYRAIQMAFCWIAILFMSFATGYVYYTFQTFVFAGYVVLTPWNLGYVAAIVLLIAAIIFIRKDDELVKSLDRLRD